MSAEEKGIVNDTQPTAPVTDMSPEETKTETKKTNRSAKSEKKKGKYTEEKNIIRLPVEKDGASDVTVSINGMVSKIQRGVEVEVSAAVYEVLKNQERMDSIAVMRQRELANG